MWWSKVSPLSPFVAKLSLLAIVLGGIASLLNLFGIRLIADSISLGVLGVGVIGSLFIFFWVAPYEVWKQDTEALQQRIDQLQPLEDYENSLRTKDSDALHIVLRRVRLVIQNGEKKVLPVVDVVSSLTYDIQIKRVTLALEVNSVRPDNMWIAVEDQFRLSRGLCNELPIYSPLSLNGEGFRRAMEQFEQAKKAQVLVDVHLYVSGRDKPIQLMSQGYSYPLE